jgi:hypothetical protein
MLKSKFVYLLFAFAFLSINACKRQDSQIASVAEVPMVAASTEQPNIAEPLPAAITTATWDTQDHKFGEIKVGDVAKHRFIITNKGTADLMIENAKPSCSCTVSEYTTEPIAPGKSGFVDAEMAAKSVGIFKKSISVTMNTDPKIVTLSFSGEVVE